MRKAQPTPKGGKDEQTGVGIFGTSEDIPQGNLARPNRPHPATYNHHLKANSFCDSVQLAGRRA